MNKLLFNTTTQQTLPYPRQDNQPVVGLDPAFITLTRVETEPPEHDPETHQATSTYEVDTEAGEYRQVWTVSPLPTPGPQPDWDGFNEYMMADPTFKTYRDTARTVDGDINSALYDGYSLVATNGVGAFSLVWSSWCQASGITSEDQNVVADSADGFGLPAEFVVVIRGPNPHNLG